MWVSQEVWQRPRMLEIRRGNSVVCVQAFTVVVAAIIVFSGLMSQQEIHCGRMSCRKASTQKPFSIIIVSPPSGGHGASLKASASSSIQPRHRSRRESGRDGGEQRRHLTLRRSCGRRSARSRRCRREAAEQTWSVELARSHWQQRLTLLVADVPSQDVSSTPAVARSRHYY